MSKNYAGFNATLHGNPCSVLKNNGKYATIQFSDGYVSNVRMDRLKILEPESIEKIDLEKNIENVQSKESKVFSEFAPIKPKITIENLQKKIREVNLANHWPVSNVDHFNSALENYFIPAQIALITSELSEALEAFRNKDFNNFKEELADTAIRLFCFAYGFNFDLEKEMLKKLEINKTRGVKHGGKKC